MICNSYTSASYININSQKIHELTLIVEKMHKKIEEFRQKYEKADVDHDYI